jgi:hypothetical protein
MMAPVIGVPDLHTAPPTSSRQEPAVRFACVPKNNLMLVAGVVWCAAGLMVTLVGLPLQVRLAQGNPVLVPLAVAVFVLFYGAVFSRLVRLHTSRIRACPEHRLPLYLCFSASSWAVMGVMMSGGLAIRSAGAVPDWAVAFFYSGLGLALFLCGLRFVAAFLRRDVLAPVPAA